MKVDKVQAWPVPKTIQAVRQFLGFCSYYRQFIQKFAKIAKPLYKLTEQNAKLKGTQKGQKAFDQLLEYLFTMPILAYPNFSREFVLDTDASNTGIGSSFVPRT